MVASVNVTELRQNLAVYLERARKGQRVRVTSRGKAIAELGPPNGSVDETAVARALLKGSVNRYDRPLEPAAPTEDWEVER